MILILAKRKFHFKYKQKNKWNIPFFKYFITTIPYDITFFCINVAETLPLT